MKIQPYQVMNAYKSKTNPSKQPVTKPKVQKLDDYLPGKQRQEFIYSKKVFGKRQNGIEGIIKQDEDAYNSLRKIVIELLERQGYTVKRLNLFEEKTITIDETAGERAAELISENGPLGAEAVSNKIVDFAIATCGGDKTKLEEIKAAIKKGFEQVKRMLGELPEVSLRTYDLTMEKMDRWAAEQ